jgi:hypothetical protein
MDPNDGSGWERETVINLCDAEPGAVNVWTSQRHVGRWLEKACLAYKVPLKKTSRPTWEAIGLPRRLILFRSSVPRGRTLTPEQKAAGADRLAKARAARTAKPK